ncbi:MAG: LysM peptidoglycan-binding domain-containing protein [Propionibacteriaceae bacterium]|nr:LysM peptidoglycan-binding domain-containing protein [Propionibacteriaceae bacterium]
MKRWISSALASGTLALIIVGAPVVLLAWGRLPRLDRGLFGPAVDGSLLLGALTAAGWLAWAVFLVATVAEAVALRAGRRVRVPGMRAVQRLAGGLLLLAVAVLPAGGGERPASRIVAAGTSALAPAVPAVGVPGDAGSGDAGSGGTHPGDTSPDVAAAASPRYSVQRGDDLWTVAERLLGDGRQWRRIAELNPSLADPTRELVAGTQLVLPEPVAAESVAAETVAAEPVAGESVRGGPIDAESAAPESVAPESVAPESAFDDSVSEVVDEPVRALAAPARPAATQEVTVRVRKGDTLSELAEQHLGKAGRWPRIAAANPVITDPDHIEIGWRLTIPGARRALSAQEPAGEAGSAPGRAADGTAGDPGPAPGASSRPAMPPEPASSATSDGSPDRSGTDPVAPSSVGSSGISPEPSGEPGIAGGPSGGRRTTPAASRSGEPEAGPTPSVRPNADAPPSGVSSAGPTPSVRADADAAPSGGPVAASTPLPSESGTGASRPSGANTPTPSPEVGGTDSATPQTPAPDDGQPLRAPLTVGTLAAAALVGTLEARRALRERARPLGRHQPPASAEADRLRTALRIEQRPASLDGLAATLRRLGRHCHTSGLDLPDLAAVRVGVDSIEFEWAEPCSSPPPGFSGDTTRWVAAPPVADEPDHPCPYPALVSLGTAADGGVLLVDAERSRVLGVAGSAELQADALSAMGVELACAPWSREARLVVCGRGAELVQRAGEERVQAVPQPKALTLLRTVVAERRAALASEPLRRLRVDPDRADAVAPYVFLFLDGVADETLAEVEQLLAGEPAGVAIIVPTGSAAPALWQVSGDPARPDGTLAGRPGSLAAHAISASARESLGELLADAEPLPAPWWAQDNVYPLPSRAEEEVDIVRLSGQARHPRLLLIGPADLVGAGGPEPTRSRQQLVELCAWLVEHPGGTATQMATGMALAEGTRRSNLSRLRTWLGEDPDGRAYLPEAYSGRIRLHSAITSDWQQVQVMLRPGLERVPDSTLVAVLDLVRGAPLADAAPGQWYWAEELRTEISAALRDVGVVLTERALRVHDLDLARWAASRALTVAPEDELLLRARLTTEYQAGHLTDCERLVNQLTRQAKILGVDLMPETIELCQRVIEGQLRARA